jgi:hypothetical protein
MYLLHEPHRGGCQNNTSAAKAMEERAIPAKKVLFPVDPRFFSPVILNISPMALDACLATQNARSVQLCPRGQ